MLKHAGNDATLEVAASAVGVTLGFDTPPISLQVMDRGVRSAWCATGAELPVAIASAREVLLMSYVDAVPLDRAAALYRGADRAQRSALHAAIGALWALDIFIDNSDRLIKGLNTENMLVGANLRLFAIDQALGRDVTSGCVERPKRRLAEITAPAARHALCRDLFQELNATLRGFELDDHFLCEAADGMAVGIRRIANAADADLPCQWPLLSSIRDEFRRIADSQSTNRR